MTALPAFVDHWPYTTRAFHAAGVTAFSFLVEGDLDCLRAYCQRYLVEPAPRGLAVEPTSRYLVVQFARTEHMQGAGDSFPDIGSQNEVSVVFFARSRDADGHEEIVAISPYIIVDNPLSAAQAHECFGLPKELGRLEPDIPADAAAEPDRLAAAVMGCAAPSAPGACYAWAPLIEVERTHTADQGLKGALERVAAALQRPELSLREAEAALAAALGEAELGLSLLPDLLASGFRMLTLKQFKDVSSSRFACYQSLVALTMRLVEPHNIHHLDGSYRVKFGNLGTHPLGCELGLVGERQAKLSWAFSYDLDLDGTELR